MRSLILLCPLLLTGCGSESTIENPLNYQVKTMDFETLVPAKGYLAAATATAVNSPVGSRGPQTLAWLAPEYSVVKKGDVIVRFEGERLERERQDLNNQLAITNEDILGKKTDLTAEKAVLGYDLSSVAQEKEFSQNYNIDDERIRSKLDIIDSAQNTEFLIAKEQFLGWKNERFSNSSAGEMALLNMQEQQQQQKIGLVTNNLSQLEVTAPHDGLLTYQADWRGEKPKAGQTLWPGEKIAELPDTSVMELKLFVSEREAIDLAVGQTVTFKLNANAEQQFSGVISDVAPFPQSIKRGDPQKFYQLKASVAHNDAAFLPGLKLTASIAVHNSQPLLAIPIQAVFKEQNADFVYVYQQGKYQKTPVVLGKRSISHVEVISGLTEQNIVSLVDQAGV